MKFDDIPSRRPPRLHEAGFVAFDEAPVYRAVDVGDVAIGDWDDLFRAVTDRLTLVAGSHQSTQTGLPLPGNPLQLRDCMLECVAALEQLHQTLRHEFERQRQREQQVVDALNALARAQAPAQIQRDETKLRD